MAAKSKKTGARQSLRLRRHLRIRKKISGTPERPRLVVYRSLRNIEGQLVDDESGRTLVGMSTLAKELRGFKAEGANPRAEHAHAAGKALAERAREQGIQTVVFDRGGYKYHGRVKAFAEGAREGGLEF
jgi:large subunit ribosomal protein L18